MILIPLMNPVYAWFDRRGIRTTPLRRMTVGMLMTSLSFVVVALIQRRIDAEGEGRVWIVWQILAYLCLTIGEVMGTSPDGDRVVLVSSGEETAFEVAAILDSVGARRHPSPAGGEPARRTFLTSGDPATFRSLGARFLGPEVDAVKGWRWN